MTQLEHLISIIGFLILLGGIVYNFATSKAKDEGIQKALNDKIDQHIGDNKEDLNGIGFKIERIEKWQEVHGKESNDWRMDFQRQISKIETGMVSNTNQYTQLTSMINAMNTNILERISGLEQIIISIKKEN